MNLVIDLGNTNVKMAIFHNNKMIEHLTIPKLSITYLKKVKHKYPSIKYLGFSNTGPPINGLDRFCQE